MSEKWEKEFFEWKDEIESKFNNLSQKNTELENKFEKMLYVEDIKKMKETIGKLKDFPNLQEHIADLYKQVNNNATEVDTRFSISETVLQNFMEVIRTYACEEISECIPELQEKLKSYPVQNRIDRLDAGIKVLKKHEEALKDLIPKQVVGGMPYFRINCPFCEGYSVSDVIDSIKEVDGQWECSNGHQFVVKYLGKIE